MKLEESSIKQQRRSHINEVAKELFRQEGLAGTTMQQIAKKAKIGRRTLYEYYATKDELVFELRNNALDVLHTLFFQLEDKSTGYEQVEYIWETIYDHWVKNMDKHLFILEFNLYYNRDGSLEEIGMPREYPMYKILENSIDMGINDGSIKIENMNAKEFVMNIGNVIYGIVTRFSMRKKYKYGEGKYYTTEDAKKLIHYMLNTIKGTK